MVERGEGRTLEEGLIIFADGQAIEARVNQQSGTAAFNYLSTWQKCHFSFISQTVARHSPPQITKPLPNTPSGPVNGSVTPGADSAWTKPATGQRNGFREQSNTASLPQRLLRGEEALQYPEHIPLPRVHRRLLLLIDGRRSVGELARLMTRDVNEVHRLLNDLERAGLIQQ